MRTINRGFFASAASRWCWSGSPRSSTWRTGGRWRGRPRARPVHRDQADDLLLHRHQYKPVQEIAEASRPGRPPPSWPASPPAWRRRSARHPGRRQGDRRGRAHRQRRGLDFQLYMISLAGMGMLTTVGVVVSMDTFGPISDNAQGIAEDVRRRRARNRCLTSSTRSTPPRRSPRASSPPRRARRHQPVRLVPAGPAGCRRGPGERRHPDRAADRDGRPADRRLGGVHVLGPGDRAVGRAAHGRVVFEVRKQFREHPGIMDYTERPDYGAVVDICTRDSL